MESWIAWARGPAFVFAIAFMLLGLLRHVLLTGLEVVRAMRRAGEKTLSLRKVFVATVQWLVPAGKLRSRFLFSLTSVLFHVGVIIVPLFLLGHIALWARGLGVSWPGIPNLLADGLTVLAVVTALALVIQRMAARTTRGLSRWSDYALPLVVALPFASGFFVMHPSLDPFSFQAMFLIHVLSGDLLLVLIPITRLSHIALMPQGQLISEVAWHWPADAGSKLAVSLHKEDEPI